MSRLPPNCAERDAVSLSAASILESSLLWTRQSLHKVWSEMRVSLMDYAEYLKTYNSGDHRELVRRFCTDDVVFEAGSLKRVFRGKDEVLEFLLGLQDGVRDVLRPQVVLQDGNHIFAEADMDLYAQKDLPEFPPGALKRGESLTMKVFVVYYLRDGKICRIKTSLWPANFGVTAPPTGGVGPLPA